MSILNFAQNGGVNGVDMSGVPLGGIAEVNSALKAPPPGYIFPHPTDRQLLSQEAYPELYSLVGLGAPDNAPLDGGWTELSTASAVNMEDIIFDGDQFIAIGDKYLVTAPDASGPWAANPNRPVAPHRLYSIMKDSVSGLYVIGGNQGHIWTARDPAGQWTRNINVPNSARHIRKVVRFGSRLVAAAQGNGAVTIWWADTPTGQWTEVEIPRLLNYDSGVYSVATDGERLSALYQRSDGTGRQAIAVMSTTNPTVGSGWAHATFAPWSTIPEIPVGLVCAHDGVQHRWIAYNSLGQGWVTTDVTNTSWSWAFNSSEYSTRSANALFYDADIKNWIFVASNNLVAQSNRYGQNFSSNQALVNSPSGRNAAIAKGKNKWVVVADSGKAFFRNQFSFDTNNLFPIDPIKGKVAGYVPIMRVK